MIPLCLKCFNMYCQCISCPGVFSVVCIKEWESGIMCHHNPDSDQCLGFISEPVNVEDNE